VQKDVEENLILKVLQNIKRFAKKSSSKKENNLMHKLKEFKINNN
jgi:hypothetical protein